MTTQQLSVNIGDENLKKLISEAVLQAIGPEARDALIKEALEKLVMPTELEQRYGVPKKGPSVIERSFSHAVSSVGSDVVHELVKNDPEIRKLVETLVRDTLLAFLKREDAGDRVATAIWEGIEKAMDR
jgi:hypothetical protein